MKEQFVTYEIGLKLKEIGFNEECMAGYLLQTATLFSDIPHTLDGNIHKNSEGSFTCAPLWQQVIDWFREKCEIEIIVEKGPDDIGYSYHIYYKTDGKYRELSGFGHHEEVEIEYDHYYARKKAIEHGLKLHTLKLQSGI
jgi:hypothetical protein